MQEKTRQTIFRDSSKVVFLWSLCCISSFSSCVLVLCQLSQHQCMQQDCVGRAAPSRALNAQLFPPRPIDCNVWSSASARCAPCARASKTSAGAVISAATGNNTTWPVGVPKMLPNAKLSHHPRKVNVDQLWLTARRDKPVRTRVSTIFQRIARCFSKSKFLITHFPFLKSCSTWCHIDSVADHPWSMAPSACPAGSALRRTFTA